MKRVNELFPSREEKIPLFPIKKCVAFDTGPEEARLKKKETLAFRELKSQPVSFFIFSYQLSQEWPWKKQSPKTGM